jgi:Bax protein
MRFLLLLLGFLLLAQPVEAEIKMHTANGVIYVDETTVDELEDLFIKHNYTRFRAMDNHEFPAIFVKKLPLDYAEITSLKYRNELFIRMLTPLALKINEEISNERQALLRLERRYFKAKNLSEDDKEMLETLAVKYDVFTRAKGESRIDTLLVQLKLRINTIPPALLVAIAAMESNWGFSRVAREANSLYKEKLWYTNEGLEPLENKDDGYRFRIFDSLIESMRSFALSFNSNIKYQYVWIARKDADKRQPHLIGESLAYTLSLQSNLPNYVGILDYTTAFYDFIHLDTGQLKRIE